MRILLIFSSSQLGGAERSLSRMALNSNNVTYQLATIGEEGPWCEWVRSRGHDPIVFGNKDGLITFTQNLFKTIINSSFNVVYVCGARASLILRLIMVFTPKIKLVHGVRWNPNSKSVLDKCFRLMEIFSQSMVDYWITNSNIARNTLIERCYISPKKVSVIHNGIDHLPENLEKIPNRPLEIITVANLNLRKGYLEYISAIKYVSEKVPDARFIIIGRDDMGGRLQHAITQNGLDNIVKYLGFLEDVSPWYRRARMFVLPSLWGEGCPTTILESHAYGLPVVAYSIDGIPEVVSDEIDGIVVPANDCKALAKSIVKLLENPELANKLGEAGRRKIENDFLISSCVDNHSKIFRGLDF